VSTSPRAFEHRRHWLVPALAADVAAAGQQTAGHPLLGAVIELPDEEGLLLTGRVDLTTHPWLADHAATGVVLVPGTAYVDMVLHAAGLTRYSHIAELTLHAPMVLPDQESLELRLRIAPPDGHGHRPVTLHARLQTAADTDPSTWTLHATARLTQETPQDRPVADLGVWPPENARPVDLTDLRTNLAQAGYDYGPAFTGLRSACAGTTTSTPRPSCPTDWGPLDTPSTRRCSTPCCTPSPSPTPLGRRPTDVTARGSPSPSPGSRSTGRLPPRGCVSTCAARSPTPSAWGPPTTPAPRFCPSTP
jgi:acyl transferase domain-containing protein